MAQNEWGLVRMGLVQRLVAGAPPPSSLYENGRGGGKRNSEEEEEVGASAPAISMGREGHHLPLLGSGGVT